MKKIKLGIACLVLGMSVSAVYAESNNRNQYNQKNYQTGAAVESSVVPSKNSVKKTKSITTDDIFNVIIQESQSQIPYFKKKYGDNFLKDITITGKPDHTIVYTYTVARPSIATLDMQALKPVLVRAFKSCIDNIKIIVPDAKFQYVFLGLDGSELGNVVITQKDTDNVDDEVDLNNINDKFNFLIAAAQTQTPALKKQMGSIFTDVNITGTPDHTIIYTYVFKKSITYMDIKAFRIASVKRFKPTFNRMITLIPDVKVKVVYLNPNGSIWDKFIITKDNIDTLSQ